MTAGAGALPGAAAASTRRLPSGKHGLSREAVEDSQRVRMLDAMAREVAARGFGGTSVRHVVSAAGVSRKTFYEHFANKTACFLALYDEMLALLRARARDAAASEADVTRRAQASVRALVESMEEEPGLVRVCLTEPFAAGPAAMQRYWRLLQLIEGLLEGASWSRSTVPSEVIAGGIAVELVRRFTTGSSQPLDEILRALAPDRP
ncbi:MAG: helix-turn-helix domain-containing protein [Thermoleophilaceae bacterium]